MTTRRLALVLCGVLAALLAAGCTAAAGPSATARPVEATSEPAMEETAGPGIETASPAPLLPTIDPGDTAGPPVATLAGPGGAPVDGMLGSYTWDDAGSDAPWLVPPVGQAIRGPGPFAVAFSPDLAAASWTARWAPVVDGVADEPALSSSGGPGRILVPAPGGQGTWSLQLDVSFADGGRAAWYWRLGPVP